MILAIAESGENARGFLILNINIANHVIDLY